MEMGEGIRPKRRNEFNIEMAFCCFGQLIKSNNHYGCSFCFKCRYTWCRLDWVIWWWTPTRRSQRCKDFHCKRFAAFRPVSCVTENCHRVQSWIALESVCHVIFRVGFFGGIFSIFQLKYTPFLRWVHSQRESWIWRQVPEVFDGNCANQF